MLGFQRLRVAWPISKEEWWHYYWSMCDVLACFISEYVGLFMSMWANHPGRDSCSGKCLWSWSPTKSRSSWPWKEGINYAYGFSYGSSAKLDKWEWYPPIKHGNGSPWMIGKTCIGDFPASHVWLPEDTTWFEVFFWLNLEEILSLISPHTARRGSSKKNTDPITATCCRRFVDQIPIGQQSATVLVQFHLGG